MSSQEREDEDPVDTSHLDGLADGCGCAEVWEHLSEGRAAEESADEQIAEPADD